LDTTAVIAAEFFNASLAPRVVEAFKRRLAGGEQFQFQRQHLAEFEQNVRVGFLSNLAGIWRLLANSHVILCRCVFARQAGHRCPSAIHFMRSNLQATELAHVKKSSAAMCGRKRKRNKKTTQRKNSKNNRTNKRRDATKV